MSVFVSTTFYGDGSDVCDALFQLGEKVDCIEIGSNHRELKKELTLDSRKLYILHNYFPPNGRDFILNMADEQEEIRDQTVRFIKASIDYCSEKGIKTYTIHPGFLGSAVAQHDNRGNRNFDLVFKKNSMNKNKAEQIAAGNIDKLYDYAQEKRVNLLIENMGSKTSNEFVIFDSYDDLVYLKKIVPRVMFNFNLAHATLAGIDFKNLEIVDFIFRNSSHFELSEIKGDFDSHLPVKPGKGVIGSLLKEQRDRFIDKHVIVELRNLPTDEVIRSYMEVKEFLC